MGIFSPGKDKARTFFILYKGQTLLLGWDFEHISMPNIAHSIARTRSADILDQPSPPHLRNYGKSSVLLP